VILPSLLASFKLNCDMNGLNKTLTEVHGMLKTVEESLRKAPGHMITTQKSKEHNCSAKAKKKKVASSFDDV
jgi:hypothetical protein